jgi:hypothetical protein
MQFFIAASVFAAAALAAPAPVPQDNVPARTETVDITKFFLRKNTEKGTIDSVDFLLSGDEATDIQCAISNPTLPSETTTCGDSPYSFVLTAPKDDSSEVTLALYHQTGQASGLWTDGPAPATYCHAGGNGAGDFVCQQIEAKTTYVLHQ